MIVVRPATPADIPLLERWDEDPDVIASGADDEWNWDTEIPRQVPWREMLIAEHAGRPIGFVQLIDARDEETHYWGDEVEAGAWAIDIWIGTAADRGQGHGSEIMRQAIARCFDHHDAPAVLIDPLETNTRAHRFYERLGFRFVEHRWFDDDHCRVYRLERRDRPDRLPTSGPRA